MHDFYDCDNMLNNFTTHGALITSGTTPNIMTASWGTIGVLWGKKVAIIPIRGSRYTKEIIDKSGEFTISVPYDDNLMQALKACGTKSGRNVDKVAYCGLDIVEAKSVGTFVVCGCEKYFECRVICVIPLNDENCPECLKNEFYKDGNYHYLFIAEITADY